MIGPIAAPLLIAAAAAPAIPSPAPQALGKALRESTRSDCGTPDPGDILVCAKPNGTYRVDPLILAIEGKSEEGPARRPLDASRTVAGSQCIGPQKCGSEILPLVAIALAALKAGELAAKGEDWKGAFRTEPPEYQRYSAEKARAKQRPRVKLVFGSER